MNRYRTLERERCKLTAQISDLLSNVPDGHDAAAIALAALYAALVDALSEEIRLAPELVLGEALVDRIRSEREYALANAEHWKGSALAWRDLEAGDLEPAS